MLTISPEQAETIERDWLVRLKEQFARELWTKYPAQCRKIGAQALLDFVRDAMNASRALMFDETSEIAEFVLLSFSAAHISPIPNGAELFAGIMLSENSNRARLAFAQEVLLGKSGSSDALPLL